MICCKIVMNYGQKDADFNSFADELMKYGDLYFFNNASLYFCDTKNEEVNVDFIENIIKKYGYKKFFVDEYTEDNKPEEQQDFINQWLLEGLLKINCKKFENEQQELFHDISDGLDAIDKEIERLKDQADK